MQDAVRSKLIYQRIAINSKISIHDLSEALATENQANTCFHINIMETSSVDFNFQLYQLLVVGVLIDSHGKIYCIRKQDCFSIELPASALQELQEKFFLCRQFPRRTEVRVNPLQLNSADEHIQFVCKMLNVYLNNPARLLNEEMISVAKDPILDPNACFALLNQVTRNLAHRDILQESLIPVRTALHKSTDFN